MITFGQINRRNFLSTLFSTSALLILQPFPTLAKMGSSNCPETIADQLSNFFIHKQSAAFIGREYLRNKPNESDLDLLIDLICSFQREQYSEIAKTDIKELRKLLMLKQRLDFEHGRTVNIRGWILSESEARLCALAALV